MIKFNRKYKIIIALVMLLLLLAACITPPPPPPPPFVEREPIIPATTKVPDKATRDLLSVYNPETGIMRFTNTTAILDSLKTGDVFVGEPSSAAPYGYLRKVNKISREGAEVILETTQAKLTDAIHQGTLNVEGKLQPSQLRSVTPLMEGAYGGVVEGATDDSHAITGELQPQLEVGKGFFFEAGIDGVYETKETAENGSGSFKASVKGLVQFNVGFRVIVDVSPLADLNYFEASMGFEEQVIVKLSAEGKGNFKKEWPITTLEFDPLKFLIGPVPVIIVPSVTATLGVDGNMQVKFNYEFSQTAAFVQGVKWDENNGFSKIDRNEFNVKHEGPSFSGEANFRAYARGNLRALLYNVGGADVGATVGAKLDIALLRDPLWILSGFVKGDLSLVAEIELLGINERYSKELFNIEREIARGEAKPPIITIINPNATVDLRVEKNIAGFFSVSHPVAKNVMLTINSDVLSTIYNGDLSIDPLAFAPVIKYTFKTAGRQNITLIAAYAGKESRATFSLDVINSAPTLKVNFSGDAHQGEPYPMTALARDINEPDLKKLCDNTTWSVIGTDVVAKPTGCQQMVTFNDVGIRSVVVTTRDSEGLKSTQRIFINILPPLENPFPRIKTFGVYSRELVGFARVCDSVPVDFGKTIDIDEQGCRNPITGLTPERYFGSVEVENPSGEALSYDWLFTYEDTLGGTFTIADIKDSPSVSLELLSPGNQIRFTAPSCKLTVTVNAADSSRSKTRVVWNGSCSLTISPPPPK